MSISVKSNIKLKNVVKQHISIHSDSAFVIEPNKHSGKAVKYSEFIDTAKKFENDLSVAEYEDRFWLHMKSEPKDDMIPSYAIDNDLTLFKNECKSWNLSRLTYKDSIIHEVLLCSFLFDVPIPYE